MWFVIRVKANAERRVAQALIGREIDVFLPLQQRLSKERGRGVIGVPLFPGYLFAQFDAHDVLSVLVCPGVVCVLSRGNIPEPVDHSEMYALRTLVEAALPLSPLPTFATGQKVRIGYGPLADLEAIVLREASRSRLIVSISLLQRSVCAEVDREWLNDLRPERRVHMTSWLPAIV